MICIFVSCLRYLTFIYLFTNFENIRKIGSSIAHITLVFVDIIKGIDKDTLDFLSDNIESLTYDRIILVLNKIDTIYGYKQMNHANIKKILNSC